MVADPRPHGTTAASWRPELAAALDELSSRASQEHDVAAVYALTAHVAVTVGTVALTVVAHEDRHLELGAVAHRPARARPDITTRLHDSLPATSERVGRLLRGATRQLRGSELRTLRAADVGGALAEIPDGHVAVATLERRGRWYGGLVVVRRRKAGPFGDADLAFLDEVAHRAGVHLDTAHSFADLARAERLAQTRAEQQAAVADLGSFALRQDELQPVLDRATRVVAEGLQVPVVSLMTVEGDQLLLRSGVGLGDGVLGEVTVPLGGATQAARALASEAPLVVDDLAHDRRFAGNPVLDAAGVRSSIAVRIVGRDAPYGVLAAHDVVPHSFTPADVEFVRTVALVVAGAAAQAGRSPSGSGRSPAKVSRPAPLDGSDEHAPVRPAVPPSYLADEQAAGRLAFFEHALDGLLVTAPDGRIFDANPAACALLGYNREELRALGRSHLADPADRRWSDALRERRETGRLRRELTFLRGDGSALEAEVTSQIFEVHGEERTAMVIRDVRDRVRLERELRKNLEDHTRLALVDELTGLPNRRSFFTTTERLLTEASAAGRSLHVLVADVDGLKPTNDRFGHQAGDQLLADVAEVLTAHFTIASVVARLAGDEFVLVVDDYDEDEVTALVDSLDAAMEECRVRHGRPFPVEVSIGSAVHHPDDESTLDELLQRADTAMYATKQHRTRARPPR
jgi:diguanylate cyclase (GGDEF)-like protein/PAS domain S-box-containing protein